MAKRTSAMSKENIDQVLAFHGHVCPGVTRGIRVAEIALRELGSHAVDEEIVAVCETNNCAVDAIQVLVGCTFGKGNLIHLDHGQNIFTFSRRSDGRTIRISAKTGRAKDIAPEIQAAIKAGKAGTATPEQQAAHAAWWRERSLSVLDMDETELYDVVELSDYAIPSPAEIHASIPCARCGQLTMAPRLTKVGEQLFCFKCLGVEGHHGSTTVTPIGIVQSPLSGAEGEPHCSRARIVVDRQFVQGLADLDRYARAMVVFWFHKTRGPVELQVHPRGDMTRDKQGIFSVRGPNRPNPIGVTVVDIVSMDGYVVTVDGLDAWDGSPVLDIKGER